jgi:hypothetical protein
LRVDLVQVKVSRCERPEEDTGALTPPIETVTAPPFVAGEESVAAAQVAGSLVTAPSPVQYIDIYSPDWTGREPGKAPVGAAMNAPLATNTVPWFAEFTRKIPGA